MNNSVMDDADKMERVCGYLRMLERTRLLRNTTEELERLVEFSVSTMQACRWADMYR